MGRIFFSQMQVLLAMVSKSSVSDPASTSEIPLSISLSHRQLSLVLYRTCVTWPPIAAREYRGGEVSRKEGSEHQVTLTAVKLQP